MSFGSLNTFITFFLVLCVLPKLALAQSSWRLPIQNELYQPDDSALENDFSFIARPSFDFSQTSYSLHFEALVRYSSNQTSRRYILPQDVFIKLPINYNWSLLFGTKIYNWGALEAFSPLDFINSRNFNASFHSEEKLGDLVLQIQSFTSFGTFQFIYQPFLTDPQYPDVHSPFGFGFDLDNPQWNSSGSSPQKQTQSIQFNKGFPQLSLKWEKTVNSYDLLAFYSRHYEKNHFYIGTTDFLRLSNNPPIYQALSPYNVPHMIDMHSLGAGLVKGFNNWLFKTELIYNRPVKEIEIYNPLSGRAKISSHTVWDLGAQWSPQVFSSLKTVFYFEWQKVFGYKSKKQRQIFELFQNDIALMFKVSNNAIYEQSLKFAYIFDLEINSQSILSLDYSKRLKESLKTHLRAQWIQTPKSNETTNFNLLKNRTHYFVAIEYFF